MENHNKKANTTEDTFYIKELLDKHVSEDDFARDELRNGKTLHKKDGIWWIEKVKFYYGPLNKMRVCSPGKESPNPFKALVGYSCRVNEKTGNGEDYVYNILSGDNLKNYDLGKIKSPKKSQVKQGLNNCKVRLIQDVTPYLQQMKAININQAIRFDNMGAPKDYLPASYYDTYEEKWKNEMMGHFDHAGHFLLGAFVDEKLAAYIDLIILDNLWEFGAVKSHDDFLPQRPVDAIYYHILHTASLNPHCNFVINGGGADERETLTKYKSKFLLEQTTVHYAVRSIVPVGLKSLIKKLIK